MEQIKLKLFISYSHKDNKESNPYIERFEKHMAPLVNEGIIEIWYDKKVLPGEDYKNKIKDKLGGSEIICLFISSNFLSSAECMKEKEQSIELKNKKSVQVIPIILSACGWKDDNDISKLLALPTDGIPISSFSNQDEAWLDVYNGLKRVIERELKIKKLEISEEFKNFLQEVQLLTKSHPDKEIVFLDDIFLPPELDKFNEVGELEKKINFDELISNFTNYSKIVIAGENLSGKTTICKMLFIELKKINLIPVYIHNKGIFKGKIENKILDALKKQYKNFEQNDFNELKERIIPIIDDFHSIKHKGKYIENLNTYSFCVLTVDDIFSLNIKNEELIASYTFFKIRELKKSLRNELIKKWISLSDKKPSITDIDYKTLDSKVELIEEILGKNISKGIFPSYPFYILSAIVTYETFAIPLNQEITSQGYCYQAFIYFYLKKQGIKNEDIDIYINFLTELAYHFYSIRKNELSPDTFNKFINTYVQKYYLPIKQEILIKNLNQIISIDSFGNYLFRYSYLYYFFVAKYFIEHVENKEIKKEIERIINNLHVDENAYITIFMIHHSKNINILEEIELNALILFDSFNPASLKKDEVSFFDKHANKIIKATLPPPTTPPEKVREEILKKEDKLEELEEKMKKDKNDHGETLARDLRKAIRTVEVMGCIIKNRLGSIEKSKIKELFKEAMNVNLRILSSFFEIIKNNEEQKFIIDFLLKKIKKVIEEKEKEKRKLKIENLEEIAREVFWNLNFLIVYGIIYKIIRSLGSDKLIEAVEEIYKEINNPAVFLVKHGILMWHGKNLQLTEIKEKANEKGFSEIAKEVLKFMIVNYCSLHSINYKDRQRVEDILGIPAKKLLIANKKMYR